MRHKKEDENRMKALIYGNGAYFQYKRTGIKDEITGFINSYSSGVYEGYPVYLPDQIFSVEYDVVYVMAGEKAFCEMVYTLLKNGISRDKIKIGQNFKPYAEGEDLFVGENKSFFIDENNRLTYKYENICISFSTYDEFYGIRDVFCNRDYDWGMGKETVVCDIGLNIGAAALYFASRKDVLKVYSYEPFQQTYHLALYNIGRNGLLQQKIEAVNAGIGACSEKRTAAYNPSMTCGLSANEEISRIARKQYKSWGLYKEESEYMEQVSILDISEEIAKIIRDNQSKSILLKIDCEGGEYEIIQRMYEKNLLNAISVIMLEWHFKGENPIRSILEESGFYLFSFAKGTNMGNIYAINCRSQENGGTDE